MSRRTVPGRLSAAAYRALATQYRPTRREDLRVAAIQLRQRGLLPLDIAELLSISTRVVLELIGSQPERNESGPVHMRHILNETTQQLARNREQADLLAELLPESDPKPQP